MLKTIREEVTSFLFKIRIKEEEERKVEVHRPQEKECVLYIKVQTQR